MYCKSNANAVHINGIRLKLPLFRVEGLSQLLSSISCLSGFAFTQFGSKSPKQKYCIVPFPLSSGIASVTAIMQNMFT